MYSSTDPEKYNPLFFNGYALGTLLPSSVELISTAMAISLMALPWAVGVREGESHVYMAILTSTGGTQSSPLIGVVYPVGQLASQ